MQTFLINLARRPDRLAAMTAKADALGLTLTRIEAVDATRQSPEGIARWFDDAGPLGEIPRGDKCCALSHRLAWETFVAGGAEFAAFLEDDVILTPGAGRILADASWIPPGVALIKLEHYGPAHQSILVSDPRDLANGFRLARLRSRHTGAAAYILSRAAAKRLLTIASFSLPVDHLLFNPNNSPLFADLKPWQLIPAVARQQDFVGAPSDIEGTRVKLRQLSWTYVRRELIRFGYDLKLLPQQIALALSGRAKFIRINAEN